MTAAVRQVFEIPNTNSGQTAHLSGGFPLATLAGSTIVAIGTYSYDITAPGTCSDPTNGNYPSIIDIADTTAPSNGHQNFQAFVLQNAKAIPAGQPLTFTTEGTDYMGLLVMEVENVASASLADSVASWQQNITGSTLENLIAGPMALPAGDYLILGVSANVTDKGSSAPYYPAVTASGTTLGGYWFLDTIQVGGEKIATWSEYELNAAAPVKYSVTFTTPASSADDNFITIAIALKAAAAAVTTTPVSGTIEVNGQSASISGNIPAALGTGALPFAGSLSFGSASAVFSGTIPAMANTPPPPPPYTPSPDDTVIKAGSSAVITDAAGNTWGINAAALVTINGTPDTTTAHVTQLAYVGGSVWQENANNLWWAKTSPTAAWLPGPGTATSPLPATTPPPPPPPPTGNDPITAPVFDKGVFAWAGDWNGTNGACNYAYKEAGVNGPGPIIEWAAGSQPYQYWLPYPKEDKSGPASNGINFKMTGLTHFTISVKPTQAGGILTMGLYEANGPTTDISFGNSVTITDAKYGPASPVVGQWNTYVIPLSDFSTSMPAYIYKFIVQEHGTMEQTYYIDQVGFY